MVLCACFGFAHRDIVLTTRPWFGRLIMWRSSKLHVEDEIRLPPITQTIVRLSFTAGERAVYTAIKEKGRRITNEVKMRTTLTQLRLACAHPQLTDHFKNKHRDLRLDEGNVSMRVVLEGMSTPADVSRPTPQCIPSHAVTNLSLLLFVAMQEYTRNTRSARRLLSAK